MTILEKLTVPQSDGTPVSVGNTGATQVTFGGGSTGTWLGGKVQFTGVAGQSGILRYNLNAANSNAQWTFRWTVPSSFPSVITAFFSARHSGGQCFSLRYNITGSIVLYDTVNTITTVLAAGLLSANTEYVVKIKTVGASTTAGSIQIRFETTAGVLVGSEYSVSNANVTANNYAAADLGSSSFGANLTYYERNLRMNDGTGTYLDDYVSSTPLGTPVVTVTNITNPTTIGGSDGSITFSWPAVPNAASYEIDSEPGSVTTGFTTGVSGVSPATISGLAAGTYTVAVRAMP